MKKKKIIKEFKKKKQKLLINKQILILEWSSAVVPLNLLNVTGLAFKRIETRNKVFFFCV